MWKKAIFAGGLCLLVLGLVGLFLTLIFGSVTGQEFSPASFQRRSYRYFEIPVLHLQVVGIRRKNLPNPVATYLVQQEYIDKQQAEGRWDLVYESRLERDSPRCDAQLLCHYLDRTDRNGDPTWLIWTKEHPELARVLWAEVARVARQQQYVLVAELFAAAAESTHPDVLQERMAAYLEHQYHLFAVAQQESGNHPRAIKLFTAALSYNRQSLESLRGRALSLEASGRIQEAEADRRQADQLASRVAGPE